jgi:hypothetical protein
MELAVTIDVVEAKKVRVRLRTLGARTFVSVRFEHLGAQASAYAHA